MSDEYTLIQKERERQIEEEGFTPEHDAEHEPGELAQAAVCYERAEGPSAPLPGDWPWEPTWWKPRDRLRNLVRAGALWLAYSERVKSTSSSKYMNAKYHVTQIAMKIRQLNEKEGE